MFKKFILLYVIKTINSLEKNNQNMLIENFWFGELSFICKILKNSYSFFFDSVLVLYYNLSLYFKLNSLILVLVTIWLYLAK